MVEYFKKKNFYSIHSTCTFPHAVSVLSRGPQTRGRRIADDPPAGRRQILPGLAQVRR